MNRKKKKRGIFGGSLFGDVDKMFEKFGAEGELRSGYSVSVTQTPEGTKVFAKAGKATDTSELRRRLQQQYPGATIEIEGEKPLIREISTKTLEEEKQE